MEAEDPAPIWARAEPVPRRTLSRDAIVAAAIAIADAEGIDAVSIRRVAGALGARPMSLYPHIGSKDDLVDLMIDEIAGEMLMEELPREWRVALHAIAEHTWDAAIRHPWIASAASTRTAVGPNMLRHAEQSLAAVAPLDLPPERARALLLAVDTFVFGQMALELAGFHEYADARRQQAVGAYLRSALAEGDLPHLARAGVDVVFDIGSRETQFAEALDWLLDGFAGTLDADGGDRRDDLRSSGRGP